MKNLSRREFLRKASAATIGTAGALTLGPQSAGGMVSNATVPAVDEYLRGGMLYRRVGHTDLYTSVLGFGAHTDPLEKKRASRGYQLNAEGQSRRDRITARCLDLGVNFMDVYHYEGQYEPMARIAKGQRGRVLISLKHDAPGHWEQVIDDRARLFGGYVDFYRFSVHRVGEGEHYTEDGLLERWDVLRRAKQAGKIRAIGISSHGPDVMKWILENLEGLDYILFPYNFIHAKANYAEFLPLAIKKGVGLLAIKPLAAGSIVKLDSRPTPGSTPEQDPDQRRYSGKAIPREVFGKLTESLKRLSDETLCQAAMRFVYSRRFISCALPGMFQEHELTDNHAAMQRQLKVGAVENEALDCARRVACASRGKWLPEHYRWLDRHWQA